MRNPVKHFSIKVKIGGSIVLVVFAIVIFQLLYFPARQIRQLQTALEGKAIALADFAAYEVAASLEFDDTNTVREALNGVGQDPNFVFAGLYKKNGARYYAHSPRGGTGYLGSHQQPIKRSRIEYHEQILKVLTPVKSKGETLGTLIMGFSTAPLERERTNIRKTTQLAGLISILVGLAMAFVISTRLTRPILRMTEAFQQMAEGDLRLPRVMVKSMDETGRMAQAFNAMLGTMQKLDLTAHEVARGNLRISIEAKGDLAGAFNKMLTMLREFSDKATELSEGNLDVELTAKGDLADAFRKLIAAQRQIVKQITDTTALLMAAAQEFQANAEAQENGAVRQSAAVQKNRVLIEDVVQASVRIAHSASLVLRNAEKTQSNSRLVAQRIAELIAQTRRIGEVLQVINEIADKSELLALSAALEGTKAGEAGRGFSLVANQMQRLAENVMQSVSIIRETTETITGASQAATQATEESTRLAKDTTQSAREIVSIIQQQETSTNQVTQVMDDVADIARHAVVGSQKVVASSNRLKRLSDELQEVISIFKQGANG